MPKVTLYRTHMLENVSVDVVDCARVKDVLGVSVRPRSQGRGFNKVVALCGVQWCVARYTKFRFGWRYPEARLG